MGWFLAYFIMYQYILCLSKLPWAGRDILTEDWSASQALEYSKVTTLWVRALRKRECGDRTRLQVPSNAHIHTATHSSSLSLSFDVMRDTCSCIVNPYTHNHTITCICLIVHINLYRSSLFLFLVCIWVGNVLVGWLSFFKNGWVLCTCILKFQFIS